MGGFVIGTFIVLLISGLPIAFAGALAALLCFYRFGFASLTTVSHVMYSALNNFTLVGIPLFILVGSIMSRGGLIKYIFAFANSIFKRVRGGLGVAALITSAIFAAISGSSLANAAALGMILLPLLETYGYGKDFAAGMLATGGTLGILIPPSVTMILYGAMTEQSVGKLFMSGMVPGIVATAILCIFTYFWAGVKGVKPDTSPVRLSEVWMTFRQAMAILIAPVIILGGIYSGACTADESAAIASVYCLIIAVFYYRSMKPIDVANMFAEAACSSGMIMFVLSGIMLFGYVMTVSRVPQKIMDTIVQSGMPPWMFMAAVNVLLLVMGCFLDVVSIMLITVPMLYPVFIKLGVDPIHLNVIYTLNMELGTITPPVGMNLFALSGATGVPVEEVVRGVTPYIFVMLAILVIVIAFPGLSTWLPSLMRSAVR